MVCMLFIETPFKKIKFSYGKQYIVAGLGSRKANCRSSLLPLLFLIHSTSLIPSFVAEYLLQPPLTSTTTVDHTCIVSPINSFPILITFFQPHLQQAFRGKPYDTSVKEAGI